MGDYISETEAEALGKRVAPEPGRVTWLVGFPGTGVSRVLAACVRQAYSEDTRAFVYDPQMAYGSGEIPEGSLVLHGESSLEELASMAAAAVTQGCGLVALGGIRSVDGQGSFSLERSLYDVSGSLRGVASGRPRVAVLVSVYEPMGGFGTAPEGTTRDPRAFAFPMGEGFDGDRVVRISTDGTAEVLRP